MSSADSDLPEPPDHPAVAPVTCPALVALLGVAGQDWRRLISRSTSGTTRKAGPAMRNAAVPKPPATSATMPGTAGWTAARRSAALVMTTPTAQAASYWAPSAPKYATKGAP